MKICVTGAAGRLGIPTCNAVLAAGHDLVATDIRTSAELPYRVAIADLLRREQAYPLLEGCDAVIHLGNHPSHWGRDAQSVYTENVAMNINVLQAACEQGVRRLVFASSIQVGAGDRMDPAESSRLAYLPLDGALPAIGANAYAASKDAGERLLAYYARLDPQRSCIALRYPMIWNRLYGRRREFRPGRSLLDECFTFILAADAARLAVAAAEADLRGYRCYQAGCNDLAIERSVAELVEEFYPGVPHKHPLLDARSLVDLEPLERELGWTPSETIDWSQASYGGW